MIVAILEKQSTTVQRGISALLAILLMVVIAFGLLPGARALLASQEHWRQQARAQLQHARSEVALGASVRQQLDSLRSAATWQRMYSDIPGANSDSLLRQDVTTLARTVGITVQTLISLPGAQESGLQQHNVRVSASIPIDQLTRFLTALRANPRFLRVSRLTVAAAQNQNPNENPTLQVQLDISGFSRSGNGSAL